MDPHDRKKKTAYLHDAFHANFREALLHSLARFQLACPVYCLMPDPFHILTSGLAEDSDQLRFNKRLRQDLGKLLLDTPLQNQAFDHVLKEEETKANAFQAIATYISENPVRKKLSDTPASYPYIESIIPGYFGINPHEDNRWDRYWRIYNRIVSK